MENAVVAQTIFLTWVRTVGERERARLLIESILAFGGALSRCPIWVFEADLQNAPCKSLEGLGVQILPLIVPDSIGRYYFADKVCACARAEALAGSGIRTLIWLNPECLIVKPPLLLDLGPSFEVAIRPVHIQNVGLLATQPLDDFWKKIYATVGVEIIQTTVETFVDAKNIRAYFNTHAFAVNPAKGLFRQWSELFQTLIRDREFQSAACQDDLHRIFLHQAILSALIATRLDPKRVRILPPEYSYPYHLHGSVPLERRASALNDLVCVVYEEDSPLDPCAMNDIEIHEPLKTWLLSHTD